MHFAHRRRRLFIAIVVSGITLITLVVIGVYGMFRGPAETSQPEGQPHQASVAPTSPSPAEQPQQVPVTSNPERFARSVARSLFNWDTRHDAGPSEWAQALVDFADADEAAALASDVRGYLPVAEIWAQLGTYGTRQWLELESVVVPNGWSTALEQAAPGQIPPGATAFTVVGTRHREGSWATEVMRTERQVAFTVFVVCPDREPCALLRLSKLDQPLE